MKKTDELNSKLKVLKDSGEYLYAWVMKGDQVVKAAVKIVSRNGKELKLKVEKKELPYLMEIFRGSMELNFIAPESSMIFQTEYMSFENGDLIVKPTGFYRNYERRDGCRFEPVVPIKIKFTSKEKLVIKEVFDLSMGGFSIVISQNDKLEFEEKEFSAEVIYINEVIRCKVKLLKDLKLTPFMLEKCPYAGRRVSFKFVEINKQLKLLINEMMAAVKSFM